VLARIRDRNVLVVYGAIFLVGIAYGVSIALTALHLDERHFPKQDIGTLAAWFAGGIVAFSLPMGGLVRRFSGKTTLTVALLTYAASVTLFPWLESYPAIAAARFVDGAASVGVWVSSETVLLARSDRGNKAYVMSLYAVSMAVGYVLGPLAARAIVAAAPMRLAFALSGALSLVAAVFVAARLARDLPGEDRGDEAHAAGRMDDGVDAWSVLRKIKTSCFATFAYGYFQSSVVLFLPLFLIESKGIAREQTIVIPAFFAAGMLLFSSVAGRMGDRLGHLAVMRALALVGLAMIGGFVFLDRYPLMCAAVFVAGASLASISPLSLALQGMVVEKRALGRANGIYNAFYAGGMLLGPPISGAFFRPGAGGGAAMLAHLAALWLGFVIFAVAFQRDDPALDYSDRCAPSVDETAS